MNIIKPFIAKIRIKFANQRVKIVAIPSWILTGYYILKFKGEYDLFYKSFKEWHPRLYRIGDICSKNTEDFDKFKNFSYKMCVNFNKKSYKERKRFRHPKSIIIKDF